MNRTRETVNPVECLSMIVDTLNSPSIKHERVEIKSLYIATTDALKNRPARKLTLTKSGVVIEGLIDVLAAIAAWRTVQFDVARGVKGYRAYNLASKRVGPKRAPVDEMPQFLQSLQSMLRASGSA